jgi:hypothetical protein
VPWQLVVDTDLGSGGAMAHELASLVALSRAREEEVRRARMRVAEPLFTLLTGTEGAATGAQELATAFAATGLPADTPMRVLFARADDARTGVEVLAELLAEHPGAVLLAETEGDDACALAQAGASWPDDFTTTAGRALTALGRPRVVVGIGGPATVAGLRGATEVARHATAAAERGREGAAVVAGEHTGVHRLLLAGAPDELRLALRERTLAALEPHPDLLRTVRVFLEQSASPARTARALHVHVNTVRYRIARASELLDADLTDFHTQIDVYLALAIER